MVNIKPKYWNKLDKVEVDAKTVIKKNRKQIHPFHWNYFVKKNLVGAGI